MLLTTTLSVTAQVWGVACSWGSVVMCIIVGNGAERMST